MVVMIVALIIGYALGSLPVALWWGRRHGVDLRTVGDGNPGAWNALEQLGARAAAPVFVGDGLKGLVAGVGGGALAGVGGAYAGVLGAMVGHSFPVLAGFRGGKAVMTFAGGAFALSAPAAGLALAGCAVTTLLTSFKWGARVGVFGFPLAQLLFAPVGNVAATGALMTFIGLRYLGDRVTASTIGRD